MLTLKNLNKNMTDWTDEHSNINQIMEKLNEMEKYISSLKKHIVKVESEKDKLKLVPNIFWEKLIAD